MCGHHLRARCTDTTHINHTRPYIVQTFSSVHGTTISPLHLIGSSVHGALVDEAEAGGGVAGGDEDGGEDERREHDAQAPGSGSASGWGWGWG